MTDNEQANNCDDKGVAGESNGSLTPASVHISESGLYEIAPLKFELPYPGVRPISTGKKVRCSVSHVHDSEVFYVKLHVGTNDIDDDQGLVDESFEWKMAMTGVQCAEKTMILSGEVRDMMPCLSLYDDDKQWHRAIILSKTDMPLVLVQYVDFGTLEEVHIERLRHISDALVQLPVQTYMCSLANQRPINDAERSSLMEKFCAVVQGHLLEAHVVAVEKPATDFTHYLCLHVVSLYLESGAKVEIAPLEF